MCFNYLIKIRQPLVLLLLLIMVDKVRAQEKKPATGVTAGTAQKVQLSGIIVDAASKKPIAGARISVKDFSASISDDKGAFKINVSSYYDDIVITADGFEPKQIALKGKQAITVAMLDASQTSFQKAVTTPLAILPMREVTSSISQYNTNGGWKRPVETIDGLLQGNIAGLNSIRRSGTPGAGANLFLRGYNSLFGTNKPLVIVDGMIYDVNDYGQSIIANNYTNPFALINSQDIDNVTVLKDAASLYGTKGANGAIIITTARSKQQATNIDFGAYVTVNQRPSLLPVMEAADYRLYLGEILQSKGLSSAQIATMPFMKDDTASNPEYYKYHNNTNWQKKVLESSISNNYFLKVTGGDNIATYALSLGYGKSNGTVSTTDLTRYDTRFNAAFNFSRRFKGTSNLSFTFNEQILKDQGISDKTAPLFLALTKAPFLTDNEVNDKGVVSPNLAEIDFLGISNPSVLINNMQAANKYYRFSGSFGFDYEISKSFSASTLFGITYDKVRENIFIPRKGVADDTLSNAVAESRLGSQVKRLFSVFSDSRIEYKKIIKRHHSLISRIGLRYQHTNTEQDFALGFNSATDDLISVQNGLNALRQVGGGIGEWNWMNTYFNADYGYKNKLFVSLNAALDGSSRFGNQAKDGIAISGVKFAVLPSIGIGWLVSSENFMANSKIDFLKLRLTYSFTGNDDIGNYTARQTYSSQNFLGMQGLVRNGIPNPAIQWETSKKLNAGVDLAFWNERVNLSADFYKSVTDNMLVYETLPAATGFNNVLTNNGRMQNTGIDASINVRVINKTNLKWDLRVNAGTYKNEVLSVPDGRFTTEYAGATILTSNGNAANLFYGYVSNGVFRTSTEAAAAGLQKKNFDGSYSSFGAGDIHFSDLNGDKIIDENDRQIIGNANPSLVGGFSSQLTYKQFQLDALFTFSQGNDVYNYVRYRLESASGVENQLNSVRNRWRAEGHVTNMPKASFGDPMGNNRFSNRWIEDGSYLRLRSLSLAYNIPMKEGFIRNATVYVSGNNLLTFTKYLGYDPEFSARPSVLAQGIDTGLDPQFRSATLGVKIGF
jgi:TonB-linked SusC/RagA family outer membrane protein